MLGDTSVLSNLGCTVPSRLIGALMPDISLSRSLRTMNYDLIVMMAQPTRRARTSLSA